METPPNTRGKSDMLPIVEDETGTPSTSRSVDAMNAEGPEYDIGLRDQRDNTHGARPNR